MSKKIYQEVEKATRAAGGSTLTKIGREANLKSFLDVMSKNLNIQIKSIENIKTNQLKKYVDYLKEQNLSIRTIQNKLTHIRSALSASGREHFAKSEQNSNKSLGADGSCRDGTHRALSNDRYQTAVKDAEAINKGAAIAIRLQKELGLRAREAVQSVKSLKSWEKALSEGRPVSVLHGTKGGRPRLTEPNDRQEALKTVREALKVADEQKGALIRSESLQGAMRAYGRVCESIGLQGESASHSLRCMYAQERFKQHLEVLGDRKEALSATSLDLGHGDGRGTYVAQVYLKN